MSGASGRGLWTPAPPLLRSVAPASWVLRSEMDLDERASGSFSSSTLLLRESILEAGEMRDDQSVGGEKKTTTTVYIHIIKFLNTFQTHSEIFKYSKEVWLGDDVICGNMRSLQPAQTRTHHRSC